MRRRDRAPHGPGESFRPRGAGPVISAGVASVRRLDPLDTAIAVSIAAAVLYVAANIVRPAVDGDIDAPALDLVLDTVALVVIASTAALAWVRYLGRHEPIALYQTAAFLALSVANVAAVVLTLRFKGTQASDLLLPGQHQLLVFTSARLIAGATLVIGGWTALQGRRTGNVRFVLFLPAAVAIAVVAVSAVDVVPALAILTKSSDMSPDLAATPLGFVVQIAGAILAMSAAVLARKVFHRNGSIGDAYLAFGLVLASFAQLHASLYPSFHPLDVAVDDILWLGFGIALLLGIVAEAMANLSALQRANRRLEELREVEVERAALEERTRLSRELHDGLAQDLWLAKLKVAKLATTPGLTPEATRQFQDAAEAIDAGLAEARQAVAALRREPAEPLGSLCAVLGQVVDDFSDRFGIPAEWACEVPPGLHHRVQAEVMRILQEALSNVGRHADPTLVRVDARVASDVLQMTVVDNGRGFDPGMPTDGFGLASMRERAGLIGGTLTVDSRPLDGTRLTLHVPLAAGDREARA